MCSYMLVHALLYDMDSDHFDNEIFDWDEANLEHATRHGVEDFEIEQAILDMHSVETAAKKVRGERREALIGSTAGGRIVVIVYTDRGGKIRPISARDATDTEKRRYRRG